jgi:hypothetical protein
MASYYLFCWAEFEIAAPITAAHYQLFYGLCVIASLILRTIIVFLNIIHRHFVYLRVIQFFGIGFSRSRHVKAYLVGLNRQN